MPPVQNNQPGTGFGSRGKSVGLGPSVTRLGLLSAPRMSARGTILGSYSNSTFLLYYKRPIAVPTHSEDPSSESRYYSIDKTYCICPMMYELLMCREKSTEQRDNSSSSSNIGTISSRSFVLFFCWLIAAVLLRTTFPVN